MHGVLLTATAALVSLVPRQGMVGRNCPAMPSCPRWNGCLGTASNGAVFQMNCLTDFNGNIIDLASASIFSDCADACSRRSGCTAFNMKDGFCYLLGSNKGTGRTATNVNAGVQVKTASIPEPTQGSTTCSTGINCPNTDQCLYPANGKNFYARCNYDYYGGDINVGSTESLTECVDNCSTFAGCVAVTWVEGTCYLKNNNTKIVYNSWVDSAYIGA